MKYLPVFLTDLADSNRLEIALYYDSEASPERADRFLDAVQLTSAVISANPYLGRVYEENGERYDGEHVCRIALSKDNHGSRYPYYFIYRVLADRVLVLRIQGFRQDSPGLNED